VRWKPWNYCHQKFMCSCSVSNHAVFKNYLVTWHTAHRQIGSDTSIVRDYAGQSVLLTLLYTTIMREISPRTHQTNSFSGLFATFTGTQPHEQTLTLRGTIVLGPTAQNSTHCARDTMRSFLHTWHLRNSPQPPVSFAIAWVNTASMERGIASVGFVSRFRIYSILRSSKCRDLSALWRDIVTSDGTVGLDQGLNHEKGTP